MYDNLPKITQARIQGWNELTAGVFKDGHLIARFELLDDADIFATAKKVSLRSIESEKLTEEGLCGMCGKSMGDLPFMYHPVCP